MTSDATSPQSVTPTDAPVQKRAGRYLVVGLGITIFNYLLYMLLANIIINNNDLLWLSSLISTAITTIVAYILHSQITWKERNVTKSSIIRFFIWNAALAFIIGPVLTQLFSLITLVYEFAFNISSALGLPFSYEFILTTSTFGFTSVVTMIINFLFYDRFVFKKHHRVDAKRSGEKVSDTTKD